MTAEVEVLPPPFERIDVADLEVGVVITSTFVVKTAEVKLSKNDNEYAQYTFCDRTGDIVGRVFGEGHLVVKSGEVAKVRATVEQFNGSKNLKLDRIRHYSECTDLSPFERTSVFDVVELGDEFADVLRGIGGAYGNIVRDVWLDLEPYHHRFFACPAAVSNHHDWRHGLVEHTVSMLGLADKIVDHYEVMYRGYLDIDRDLVLAGVMLHDMAKVLDFEREGLAWKYTNHARLIGHIPYMTHLVLGSTVETESARQRLAHIVAAHHGQLDYGSPVVPKLIEAIIVHQVDMIDSRVGMYRAAVERLESGEAAYSRPMRREVMK